MVHSKIALALAGVLLPFGLALGEKTAGKTAAGTAKDTAGVASTTTTTTTTSTPPAPAPATGVVQETDKPDTLVGEVVDIQCLARNERLKATGAAPATTGGKEKGWGQCGTDAVRRGAPVGIRLKDGNQLYVVAMYDRKPAGRTLAQYVGKEVTVAGYKRTEAGLPLLEITKVLRSGDLRTSQAPNKD